ncbi:MAG: 4-alpha-glucanotransferase [Chlorobi bacterium]|nr:4-alpha-glucanotransferase [Chlorobiota bacterium]
MKIKITCFYRALNRENLYIITDNDGLEKQLKYTNNNLWETELEYSSLPAKNLKYKYLIKDSSDNKTIKQEKDLRSISLNTKRFQEIIIKDYYSENTNEQRLWDSSFFTRVLFNRNDNAGNKFRFPSSGKQIVEFKTKFVPVKKTHSLGISGNIPELGNWNENSALKLNGYRFPEWKAVMKIKQSLSFEYKFVIINNSTGKIIHWEKGNNRVFSPPAFPEKTCHCIINDDNISFDNYVFRSTGVAIPVFSLRTKQSFGIGDFSDLKLLTDWAVKTRLKLIQILPVNDTTAHFSHLDSYPYNTISVFALNPAYLNIFETGKLKNNKNRIRFEKLQQKLNSKYHVDYPTVLKYKLEYARLIFKEQKDSVRRNPDFRSFVTKNKKWLKPYAAFCYLRDKYGTSNFNKWEDYATYSKFKITKLLKAGQEINDEFQLWYFIQYQLSKQLKEARDYARSKEIAIKGDVPIGVGRNSVDTWCNPRLFNFDGQAGAPPDDFATEGQNWGFPTYNWNEMAKDNYKWWKERLSKMAEYFDAYRIDHILGFFRIWEVPYHAIQGILGHFRPALPFSREELQEADIWVDTNRYCKPFIREHVLEEIFGEYSDKVRKLFLNETELNIYELKTEYNTQRKVQSYFLNGRTRKELNKEETIIMSGLFRLISEVLLLAEDKMLEKFHPRISMHSTFSFMELNKSKQNALDKLYIDYYYNRHEELWKNEALKKLPPLINSTKMLVCGEDLGMIPSVVPEVMQDLKILSLEVQRMPKDPNVEFADPAKAPYYSVVTTSTHDTSTIRGWWEEDRERTQRYYNHQLGQQGEAPYFAEPWICKEIINQHLHSPAMLTIFPLQDLLAISDELRSDDTHNEQINIPSNPDHYWKYRLHLNIEELLNADDFNRTLNLMIKNSGRW